MPRDCNFINATGAEFGRWPVEVLSSQADKKIQNLENFARLIAAFARNE
jgi:hypothetical protein